MQNDSDEVMTIAEAAAECGMTLDAFLIELVLLGDIEPVGDENFRPSATALSNGTIVPTF